MRYHWYHRIELPGGIITPGWAPLSVEAYNVPQSLTEKRVLDVGAWDGFWSFEALKRGAREVVAIDDHSDYLGKLSEDDRRPWETFDLCREALDFDESVCQHHDLSVYDVGEERLGRFDVVFFFGTLYHLRYPLLALDKLAAVCDEQIFVESAILDDFSPYRGGFDKGYPDGQTVMEFYPDDQYSGNDTNWWVPTLQCLMAMLHAAGFEDIKGSKMIQGEKKSLTNCRGFATGVRKK